MLSWPKNMEIDVLWQIGADKYQIFLCICVKLTVRALRLNNITMPKSVKPLKPTSKNIPKIEMANKSIQSVNTPMKSFDEKLFETSKTTFYNDQPHE